MIDVHCHLESKDYDKDLDKVIQECKKEMKAIIISCAHLKDFEKSLGIAKKYKGFVFLTAGFHPSYISEATDEILDKYVDLIDKNKEYIIGIGECGLDYYWVKEPELREKQKELFIEHIDIAKNLNLPLVIHSRDAEKECLEILEEHKAEKVILHFFTGKGLADEVIRKKYFISFNTAILKSKSLRKLVKQMPIEYIMTETDSPWLGDGNRNTPLSVKKVISKIAEIKDMAFEKTDEITSKNAIKFFKL